MKTFRYASLSMDHPRAIRGDWMGAFYWMGGERTEWTLHISDSGHYKRVLVRDGSEPEHESGTWVYDSEQDVLTFDPDGDGDSHAWAVQDVTRCERANTLLVLRRSILASRNLPIVLYRVHHNPFDA